MSVFISYSTKNTDIADAVVHELEANGIECWYAPRNINPAEEWVSAIRRGLSEANVFILLFTDESNASKQVMNEVAIAFNEGKAIVPFKLSQAPLNPEFEYYLTRVHWLDATGGTLADNIVKLRKRTAEILDNPVVGYNNNLESSQEPRQLNNTTLPIMIIVIAVFLLLSLGMIIGGFSIKRYLDTHSNEEIEEQIENIGEAVDTIENPVPEDNEDTVDYLAIGNEHYDNGEFPEAIEAYEKIWTKDETAAFRIGKLYFYGAEGVDIDYLASIPYLTKAEELGMNTEELWKMLGYASYENGRDLQAAEYFKKMFKLDHKAETAVLVGIEYAYAKDYKEAAIWLSDALDMGYDGTHDVKGMLRSFAIEGKITDEETLNYISKWLE